MKIIKYTKKNTAEVLKETIETVKAGGLVIFPTDTVYICLVSALSKIAVSKLLEFKNRPEGKAISIFVADKTMAAKYVELNQNATNIITNLLPGPFTVICQSKHQTDLRLEAENGTLGFRIPDYPLINQLTAQLGFPTTATSANISGTGYHYSIDSLLKSLSDNKKRLIDLIVDYGKLPRHLPSTVIDTTTAEITTLRQGNLVPDTVESILSKSTRQTLDIGRFIGNKYQNKTDGKCLVFLLSGELGAGKTVLVKGLAKSLGITQTITSPTYNLVNEYPIVNKNSPYSAGIPRILAHFDLYRLNTPEEVAEIGIIGYFTAEYVIAIEWPERFGPDDITKLSQNSQIINIKIQHKDTSSRTIQIHCSK